MKTAYAIILAGGNGERFWPLSTPYCPKQFLDLFGGQPLIRQAVERLNGLIPVERTFVITAERFVTLTRQVLPMLPEANIIGEPCRRDTAAAVATACGLVLQKGEPDAVGCILTADTLISPVETFQRELALAIATADSSDRIVTMGIRPSRPDTGFGYVEFDPASGDGATSEVKRFVEKPDLETAKRYVEAGSFLWNAGMFIWKASTLRDAYQAFAPDLAPLVDAVTNARDVVPVLNELYPDIRAISVDFAVMEHVRKMAVVKASFAWDDVGCWPAADKHLPTDENGNVRLGACKLQNCRGVTAINRRSDEQILAVAGLSDAVVVQTDHATLVCTKAESKNLKALVRSL